MGQLLFPRFKHRFYDQLSRLIEADYNNGSSVLNYGYDVAGNLVDFDGTTRTFNAANQMTNDGTNTLVYDYNGNLRTVGSDTYTWDKANRLLSVGNHSYVYDGLGNRVQQTVSSVVTDYLNDLQPGLTKLLKQTTGANIEQFVHGVRGIHAVDDGTDWNFYAQDGLGSVRALMDDAGVVQSSMSYDPYGMPLGTNPSDFGFTGEQTNANGSVFLRARYYEPSKGIFTALDPFEGKSCTPMSLNGYGYVHGNPIMNTDPTGMTCCDEYRYEPVAYRACMANPANQHEETPTPAPTATPVTNSSCGFPSSSNFNQGDSEEIARVLAAIAFQQNRFVGYEAMVLTMVAAINLLDRGGTTLTGLQHSQHPYSHAGCNTQNLDACIDAQREARIAIGEHGTESEIAQTRVRERNEICSRVNQSELYSCVSGYMDFAIAGGEPFPPNSAELAEQSLAAARDLLRGRCQANDADSFFTNSDLRDAIRNMDANDRMQYVFSFDVSWYNDLPRWSQCVAERTGSPLEYIAIRSSDSNRAVLVSSDFNPLCADFQEAKGDKTSACGCSFA